MEQNLLLKIKEWYGALVAVIVGVLLNEFYSIK
jgi:hypothetical protein